MRRSSPEARKDHNDVLIAFATGRTRPTSRRVVDRAPELDVGPVVIGSGIGGLLAARVLRDHVDRVTLVDRDRFPDDSDHRAGVADPRAAVTRSRARVRDAPYHFAALRGISHWVPEEAPEQLAGLLLTHLGGGRCAAAS